MANPSAKIPPYSLDAEKATLGALMIDKDAIIKVADFLKAEDFYHEAHAIVYSAINELFNKRMPVDLVTITNHLEDRNLLSVIGGVSYLADLTADTYTASHIVEYAIIVKEKSTLRRLIKAGDIIMGLGYNETGNLPEILEEAEKSLFEVSQTFVKDRFIHVKDILAQTYEKISNLHDPEAKEKYRGALTGFRDLDNLLNGMQPSDLVILAARPSMGKTSFAINIAQNLAKQGKSVGVVSLEMSKEQLVERMFCGLLNVDSWKVRSGKLTEEDFARIGTVMDELNDLPIYIDDSSGSSINELRSKIRRLQMEHGLDFLVIDYLQMMSMNSLTNSGNRVQEISEITRALKNLARELRIPIMALSQLSRAVELRPQKIPQLSDLRDSGSIEQDADIVIMIYREDYYEEDTERKGIADIYIRKHRSGPIGRVELMFKKEQMKFLTIEKQRKADEYSFAE
ncbi:MAG: replicative DNA helicase [Candidatus Gracilibacteria bacterium]|jgi:replicative DNA helicase